MEFLSPGSLADALAAKAAYPDAVPIMGGTDVMVELNFDRHRPDTLLDLTRVPELATWDRVDGEIRLGAGVTYTRVIEELGTYDPHVAVKADRVTLVPSRIRSVLTAIAPSATNGSWKPPPPAPNPPSAV